ncbi:MAG: 3'-5' exonuclease [Bacillota bacterium]|nr:3'-5' exonuclease [Bacillota bacterium]
MSYIIFDLEFNQDYNFVKDDDYKKATNCPFEIIQIGAVKLDENLKILSCFCELVKPKIYNNIHPFVKKITGIRMSQLRSAKPFREVYKEFIEFITSDRTILCVWGMTDLKELFRNVQYHKLNSFLIPREYINVQFYASKLLNCPQGTNIGLRNSVELFNIPMTNTFHNALNDSIYTAEVFKIVYNENIKPKLYIPNSTVNSTRQNEEKQEVDTYSLIKQFEKMFKREMSQEEQSIIKLAYMMGRTNQFLIKGSSKKL